MVFTVLFGVDRDRSFRYCSEYIWFQWSLLLRRKMNALLERRIFDGKIGLFRGLYGIVPSRSWSSNGLCCSAPTFEGQR